MATSSKRAYAIPESAAIPNGSPLLICTSTGDTQTQFCLSLCGVPGSWCAQALFVYSEHLWLVWVLIVNMILPLLPSCWSSLPLVLDMGNLLTFPPVPCTAANTLGITSTLLQQHKRRVHTWTSPDGQYQNQTVYILCSQRWRSSIQSTKTRKTRSWLWLRSWTPYCQIQT